MVSLGGLIRSEDHVGVFDLHSRIFNPSMFDTCPRIQISRRITLERQPSKPSGYSKSRERGVKRISGPEIHSLNHSISNLREIEPCCANLPLASLARYDHFSFVRM